MRLHLCVHGSMCVCKRSQLGLSGMRGGAGAGGVGRNSSPFIEFNRKPKKAMCIFSFYIASNNFFFFFLNVFIV